jgi:predicted amidophosphoribosyltransferase
VRGASAVKPDPDVKTSASLLTDEVFTTGATVGERACVLRRAGARQVDVLTFARTVRQEG